MKIIYIIIGFYNLIFNKKIFNDEQKLNICLKCFYIKDFDFFKNRKFHQCKVCGCLCEAKVKSKSKCPLNKW